MSKVARNNLYFFLILFLVVIIFSTAAIKFDSYIKSPCRFVPHKEWSLVQVEPDKIQSRIIDNENNYIDSLNVFYTDRSDLIKFGMEKSIFKTSYVEKGQVVANYFSYSDNLRISELQNLLEEAKADLQILRTGEKPAIKEEAVQTLNLAQTELDAFTPQYVRIKELVAKNLASDQQLDEATAKYNLLKVSILLAEARLKVVETGAKMADVDKVQAMINNYEKQVALLQNKLDSQKITAPFSGIVMENINNSILCNVKQIDTIIVQIPIPEFHRPDINDSTEVTVFFTGINGRMDKTIIYKVSNQAEIIYGKPMYIAKAKLINSDHQILPGMTGRVRIKTGKVNIFNLTHMEWMKYVRRK